MFEIAAEDAEGFLAAVTEQLAKLPSQLYRTGNDGFAAIAAGMDAVSVQLECARVALVSEAEVRGVVEQSSATSPAQWLMRHSLHLEPAEATRTADLGRACREPRNQVLAAAVSEGSLTVRKATTCLRQLRQVEHRLDPLRREQALSSLTQMARTGYDQHVRCVGRRLMALVGADRALERDEMALRRLVSLRRAPMENGMVRYLVQLDPESAAVLDAGLDPLAAPQPSSQAGADTRLPEQRRAEALVEICRRAAAAGGQAPATTKAQVVVTIDHDALREATRGCGVTLTGEVLSPEAVRRLACDAGVLPVVLGGRGEVLDVGREKRLVTPGLLHALWLRDKGCTFPGCSRPPHWTHAHHNRHWADGGATSLLNLALLCQRHHTWVHDRGLVASITATEVTWPT
jgi:hypothetical protein